MIWFPLVIAVSEWDMPGIEPGTLGWHNREMARIRIRTGTPMTHERKRDKNRDQDKNRKKDKEKD